MCRTLYNASLQERRDAFKMRRVSISRTDQMKQFTLVRADDPEWRAPDTTIGRGVLCRSDRAFSAFFRRVKNGEKPRFPRFKSRSRHSCIKLSEAKPGMVKTRPGGKKAYVRVKGLPTITLRLKKELPPAKNLKGLTIKLRPTGVDVNLTY